MRTVANVLETLRSQLAQAPDAYSIWPAFDEQIGSADLNRFMPALVELNKKFHDAVVAAEVAQLRSAFEKDPHEGWTQWLDAYVRSFDQNGWQGLYAAEITGQALSFSPHADWPIEKIRQVTLAICDARWPEAYDWFLFLSDQEIPADYRAQFLAIAAEIQIFHFTQLNKARQLIEKAKQLTPTGLAVQNVQGRVLDCYG